MHFSSFPRKANKTLNPCLGHSEKNVKLPHQTLLASPSLLSSLLEEPALKPQRRTAINSIKELGWWWELGAVLVSLICMALIVAVLFSMDGKPLRDWKLPIQPNSLVAIFSTITKSALLTPPLERICLYQF
jgi:hypothetical protein